MHSKSATQQKQRKYLIGVLSEYFAALILILKGYSILKMRYKTRSGEIDIIARKGNIIVFVEVKFRKTTEDAISAVSHRNRKRVLTASRQFISEFTKKSPKNTPEYYIRYDIFAVSPPFLFRHLDNAWIDT